MAADLVLLIKNTEELVSSDQSQLKKTGKNVSFMN